MRWLKASVRLPSDLAPTFIMSSPTGWSSCCRASIVGFLHAAMHSMMRRSALNASANSVVASAISGSFRVPAAVVNALRGPVRISSKAATEGWTVPGDAADGVAVPFAGAGAPACASRRAATASSRATSDSMFTAISDRDVHKRSPRVPEPPWRGCPGPGIEMHGRVRASRVGDATTRAGHACDGACVR